MKQIFPADRIDEPRDFQRHKDARIANALLNGKMPASGGLSRKSQSSANSRRSPGNQSKTLLFTHPCDQPSLGPSFVEQLRQKRRRFGSEWISGVGSSLQSGGHPIEMVGYGWYCACGHWGESCFLHPLGISLITLSRVSESQITDSFVYDLQSNMTR
jgi:hypothetical protein